MRRKIFSSNKKVMILLICCMEFIYQPAQAQAAATIITALNTIRASIDALVNTAATYIFEIPPNIGNELVTNNTQSTAVQTIGPNVQTLTNTDIQNGLQPNTQNPNQNLTQLATIQASDTIVPSITVGGLPVPFYSSAMQQNMQNALAQGNQNFNFQVFLSPPQLNYSTQDLQNYGMNFIRFISGYGTPVSNINLNSYPESQLSSKQKLDIQNSASYQAFMVQRRQLLAQQSAALTNLYAIYQRRLPIPTIKASDTALGVTTPSLAQIEEYNATWRTASPTWYTQMSTASGTNVQRELLFVLAEMQVELHRLHVDNERILALTAINQANGLQTSKQTLGITERQVQDTINQQIKSNAEQGTTSTPTTTSPTAPSTTRTQGQAEQLKQSQQEAKAVEQQRTEQSGTPSQTTPTP